MSGSSQVSIDPVHIHLSDVAEKLEAALMQIADKEQDYPSGSIPYWHLIPSIARQIMLMRRVDSKANHDDRPTAEAMKALEAVAVYAKAGLNWNAMANFPPDIRIRIVLVAMEAKFLIDEINKSPKKEAQKLKRGAPKKESAYMLASFLYDEFYKLKGRNRGRSVNSYSENQNEREGGEFVKLLDSIFLTLKIKVSPSEAARSVLKAKRDMGK